jgi:SNF2 family DNA or RNA helicase
MQPAIRFRREDCYDLPDVAVEELTVELTDEQERLIRLLKQQAMANLQEGQITAANAAAVLSKVLQVMGGAVYSTINDERQQHQVPADNFFEVITDVVEQADAPVLVFAPFRGVVDRIYQALEDAGLRVGKITGDVPERERSQLFDAVQENRIDALVAVAGTMSHGLTLTTARYVIWALPPFSFEEYEQANGRVVRQGQRNNVTIYHVVHNPLAKELFNRLHSKSQLQEAVLTLLEDNTQREQ